MQAQPLAPSPRPATEMGTPFPVSSYLCPAPLTGTARSYLLSVLDMPQDSLPSEGGPQLGAY